MFIIYNTTSYKNQNSSFRVYHSVFTMVVVMITTQMACCCNNLDTLDGLSVMLFEYKHEKCIVVHEWTTCMCAHYCARCHAEWNYVMYVVEPI